MSITDKDHPWVSKITSIIFTVMLAVIAFFLKETFNSLNALELRMSKLEITSVESKALSFTHSDWLIAKTFIDNDRIKTEARLTTLETTLPQIKESLYRIEKVMEKNSHQ